MNAIDLGFDRCTFFLYFRGTGGWACFFHVHIHVQVLFYFILLFYVLLCIDTLEKVELSHKSVSLAQMDSSIVVQISIMLEKQEVYCSPQTSALICIPELTGILFRTVWSVTCLQELVFLGNAMQLSVLFMSMWDCQELTYACVIETSSPSSSAKKPTS